MKNHLVEIQLCKEAAPASWRENNAISIENNLINIHCVEADQMLSTIQRAARSIYTMGVRHVQLVGEGWALQEQWAFHQGYSTPVKAGNVTAPALPKEDYEELERLKRSYAWAKKLVNMTPEELSPLGLAERVIEYMVNLNASCVNHKILSGEELHAAGWVGVYNVGRGSERPPAMLILDYTPAGREADEFDAVLVGKGITYDSGGYSIKPSESMFSMKCDMAGAATVAASLALAIERNSQKKVRLILCCAENLISGHAYKLGDVLTYKNGVSVEIANTDAEGRLVLADGLIAASETQSPLIVDAATLTGASMVALGEDYNALFTMSTALRRSTLSVAAEENEGLWPLPLEPFHKNKCPSQFADTANSRPVKGGGLGGASNAAGFLARFVTDAESRWMHFDLSSAYLESGNDKFAAGATGVGIKTIARLISN